MHPIGAWVESRAAIDFLRRLNLPMRRIRGPRDPALRGIELLVTEAGLPPPAFAGRILLLGAGGYSLDDEGAARLLRELAPHYLPFFKTLIESVRDIVYVIDPRGRAHYANFQVRELGYFPLEPGTPLDLFAFLPPEERARAREALEALLAAPGKALAFRFRGVDAEGRERALRVWGRNLLHRPEVRGILLNVRDVGEEVRLQEALAAEAARLKALVEALPGVVFQARVAPGEDPNRAPLLFLSEQARGVLGYAPEVFLKAPGLYYQKVHPEDRPALLELAVQAVAQPHRPHSLAYRFRHGERGDWVWLRDTLRYDPGTQLLTGFTKDVTAERAQAAAARESEDRFRTLAETAPAVILMWQGERLVFANRTTLELTGYSLEELQSRPIWDFVHPEDRRQVRRNALARLRGEAAPARYPFRIVTKSGAVRWLDYSAATVEIGGRPAVLGVGLDITEDKEHKLDLELFARLSTALRRTDDVQAMLEAALGVVANFFAFPTGAILLYEEGRPWVLARRGWTERIPVADRLERTSLVATALNEERVLVLPDLKEDPRLREVARPFVPEGWSGAVVPMPVGGRWSGVLFAARPGSPPGEATVRRLQKAAETIGNAVHRAALHARLSRRVKDLEVVAEVGRAVARGPRVEHSARVLLDALMRLPFAGGAVWTFGAEGVVRRAVRGDLAGLDELESHLAAARSWFLEGVRERLWVVQAQEASPTRLGAWVRAWGIGQLWLFPLRAGGDLLGVLAVFAEKRVHLTSEDRSFLEALVAELEVALDNARRLEEVQKARRELAEAYEKTLWGWAKAVELRDQETAGHTERVTGLAERLGRALGLAGAELLDLRRGAILHDVGKLAIPDAILLKPGRLSPEEWAVMRKHPVYAYEWLKGIPYLQGALVVPLYHHERWDGSGYPKGLKGEAIPRLARIFAVADVFDALTSDRPYRRAWSREKALAHLQANAGRLFDPEVVEALLGFAERGEV